MSLGKSIHIEIENLCHEDLSKMNPTDIGRFCSACQTNVIDFSVMNDDEIINYFKNYSTQQTCGRFTIEQMSKEYFLENPKSNFRFTWMRKMVAALFLLPLSVTNVFAQKKTLPTQHKTQQKKFTDKQTPQIIIEGIVKLVDVNVPIEFVEVQIDSFKTKTDENGKFQLCLPISMMKDTVNIICNSQENLVIDDYKLNISDYISCNKKIRMYAIPRYNADELNINLFVNGLVNINKVYKMGKMGCKVDSSDSLKKSLKIDISKFVKPILKVKEKNTK